MADKRYTMSRRGASFAGMAALVLGQGLAVTPLGCDARQLVGKGLTWTPPD